MGSRQHSEETKMARKKKTKKKDEAPLEEHHGIKMGDKVFVHRYPDNKLSYGKINSFHLKQKDGGDYFGFFCEMCGSFRLGSFDDIIHDPTKDQQRKLKMARAKLYG